MEEASRAPAPGLLVRYGEFMFRYRNLVFPLVMLALFAGFRPLVDGPAWLPALAIVVAVAGQVVRVAVVGLAYIKRGGVNKRVYADTLVVDGIFTHCRNPLYVGNALILAGLFLLHGDGRALAIGGVFFALSYIAIIAAEERFLAAKFGDQYRDYCARVPRWIPRLAGLGATLGSMRFNWTRVVVKEYGSAATWVIGACLLLTWRGIAAGAPLAQASPWLVVALGALVAASVVRVLKKSGRLRERAD